MTAPSPTESSPLLSVLIFSPLAAAAVAAFIRNERLLRWWTLVVHLGRRPLLAAALVAVRPDHRATSSSSSPPHWIPALKHQLRRRH